MEKINLSGHGAGMLPRVSPANKGGGGGGLVQAGGTTAEAKKMLHRHQKNLPKKPQNKQAINHADLPSDNADMWMADAVTMAVWRRMTGGSEKHMQKKIWEAGLSERLLCVQ